MSRVRLMPLVRRSAAQARYVLVGSAMLLFGFQFLIIAQAAEIERMHAFGRMAEFIPAFLQRGLGSQALLLATFGGSVTLGYFHPVVVCLLAAIAMYITTEPSHEIEVGLVDLELARSVPRHRILTRSLLLAMVAGVVITGLMLGGTYAGLLWLAPASPWPSVRVMTMLAVHLVALAWCFAAIGLFLAAFSRRWATAFTTGLLFAIAGYAIDFLAIGWAPARVLAWLTPFQYYPAILILAGTSNTARDLGVLVVATVVFAALAYWRFEKRDL